MGLKVLDDWFAKNREKFLQRVGEFLDADEQVTAWVLAKTAPAEILDWLPLFSTYYRLKTRRFALILTARRVLQLEHGRMSVMNVTETASYPLPEITRMEIKSGPLFSDIFITARAGTLQFKEIDKTEARAFVDQFKANKPSGGSGVPAAPRVTPARSR